MKITNICIKRLAIYKAFDLYFTCEFQRRKLYMIYFLTSSSTVGRDGGLNPANGFLENLREVFTMPLSGLLAASSPDDYERNERFAESVRASFEAEGLKFSCFRVLDSRTADEAEKLVADADFIVLAGGHVPTQNKFFADIRLKELIADFDGILMGISAGTMNSAELVYAQPELPGEATDPEYSRFLPGLGITRVMVIPHYQVIKDETLDGMRLFEDITYPDSIGRQFYALPDGSYILGEDGEEELHGEAYLISEGKIQKISENGDVLRL